MSEIVNLRQARKRRDRAAEERQAADNRRRFGRDKAQKAADGAAEADRLRQLKRLEDGRLDKPEER